jgi:DNA adenine methylase
MIKNDSLGIKIKSRAKPFVKWAGGKSQLITEIEREIYKVDATNKVFSYIEPFVGGGAILFWILQKFPNIKKVVINDINKDLINAYKTVRDDVDELICELESLQGKYYACASEDKKRDFFLNLRDEFNQKNLEDIKNTSLFIFLNRTCFNGLYRVNSKGLFNVPFGKYLKPKICDKETLLADSRYLRKVVILNDDFEKTFTFANNSSVFYFDPPYRPISTTSSFTSYSKDGFNDSEQIRLKYFCDKISSQGARFILSNSDPNTREKQDSFFDNLYSTYRIERVFASRMVNSKADKRGKLSELLITNGNEEIKQIAQYA